MKLTRNVLYILRVDFVQGHNISLCLVKVEILHIQIPLTGYLGLILRSTAVATASRCTPEGTMRVL